MLLYTTWHTSLTGWVERLTLRGGRVLRRAPPLLSGISGGGGGGDDGNGEASPTLPQYPTHYVAVGLARTPSVEQCAKVLGASIGELQVLAQSSGGRRYRPVVFATQRWLEESLFQGRLLDVHADPAWKLL